jgi:hypothetical protein
LIPSTNSILQTDIEFAVRPTKQYKLEIEKNRIQGYCDGVEALILTIYHILNTQRYEYVIYSWNYGFEFWDLFGKDRAYVCSELKRRISEALCQDDRIDSVDNYKFEFLRKNAIHVTFTAHTIYGDIEAEKAVNI